MVIAQTLVMCIISLLHGDFAAIGKSHKQSKCVALIDAPRPYIIVIVDVIYRNKLPACVLLGAARSCMDKVTGCQSYCASQFTACSQSIQLSV